MFSGSDLRWKQPNLFNTPEAVGEGITILLDRLTNADRVGSDRGVVAKPGADDFMKGKDLGNDPTKCVLPKRETQGSETH